MCTTALATISYDGPPSFHPGHLQGTCAGGYLAGTANCCAQEMQGYCGGKTGCVASSYGLGLVSMGAAEPWDRGHGIVTVQFNAAGLKTLGLSPAQWGGNTSILYYQGPVQVREGCARGREGLCR